MDAGEDKEQGEDHQVAESQTTVGEDGALHDGKIALVTRKVAAAMAMGRPESNPHLRGGVLLCRAAAPSRDQPEQRADRRRGRGEQGIGFGLKK